MEAMRRGAFFILTLRWRNTTFLREQVADSARGFLSIQRLQIHEKPGIESIQPLPIVHSLLLFVHKIPAKPVQFQDDTILQLFVRECEESAKEELDPIAERITAPEHGG